MKTGIEIIADERQRHFDVEGWTPEHDDKHDIGELANMGALYACARNRYVTEFAGGQSMFSWLWPQHWDPEGWKPTPGNRIKELAKAGALIASEIDRLQRKNKKNENSTTDSEG